MLLGDLANLAGAAQVPALTVPAPFDHVAEFKAFTVQVMQVIGLALVFVGLT